MTIGSLNMSNWHFHMSQVEVYFPKYANALGFSKSQLEISSFQISNCQQTAGKVPSNFQIHNWKFPGNFQ